MKNILTIMAISALLISCKKYQKGCLVNRTAAFQVNNESATTAQFTLIQNSDTIRETIMPHTKYEYIVKAGVITKAYYIEQTHYMWSQGPDSK